MKNKSFKLLNVKWIAPIVFSVFAFNAGNVDAFLPSVNWILNRTVALYLESPTKSVRISMEGYDVSEQSQKLARSEKIYFKKGYN